MHDGDSVVVQVADPVEGVAENVDNVQAADFVEAADVAEDELVVH